MNRIEKGKRQLSGLGIVLIVIAIVFFILGIVGIVFGLTAEKINVLLFILGVVGIFISLCSVLFGVFFVWTASALVATEGNIEEDNSLSKGTVGVTKCQKCGEKLDENGECPNHKVSE